MRALMVLLLLGVSAVAGAVEVSTCGQVVPAGEVGLLAGDLDCADQSDSSVYLEQSATLDLQAHVLANAEVFCRGKRCAVRGPGSLASTPIQGPQGSKGKLVLRDFTSSGAGVSAPNDSVVASNVVLNDAPSGPGLLAGKLRAENVTANNNEDSGIGVLQSVRGTSVVVDGNGYAGVEAVKGINIVGLEAIGNARGGGVGCSGKTRLRDAVVTSNQYAGAAVDIVSARRPSLTNTTCQHSLDFVHGVPWGVCSED